MDRPPGTGPGEITDDGCAVDFYALLPSFGEPEIVHVAVGSYEIGPAELGDDLSSAGLRFARWLTGDQSWFAAYPA
jgi:hypothetical protein